MPAAPCSELRNASSRVKQYGACATLGVTAKGSPADSVLVGSAAMATRK